MGVQQPRYSKEEFSRRGQTDPFVLFLRNRVYLTDNKGT
jgi:hypothetical protein